MMDGSNLMAGPNLLKGATYTRSAFCKRKNNNRCGLDGEHTSDRNSHHRSIYGMIKIQWSKQTGKKILDPIVKHQNCRGKRKALTRVQATIREGRTAPRLYSTGDNIVVSLPTDASNFIVSIVPFNSLALMSRASQIRCCLLFF